MDEKGQKIFHKDQHEKLHGKAYGSNASSLILNFNNAMDAEQKAKSYELSQKKINSYS